MATALITGGCGFLGSHLSQNLLRRGFHVVAVDNFCTAHPDNETWLRSLPNATNSLSVVHADVTQSWKTWADIKWPSPLTHVFHFASPASPPHYQRLAMETMWVNSLGLAESIRLADAFDARVVFASTSEIYGDPTVSPQPESYFGNVNTVGVRSCYDEAKRFGESLLFTANLKANTEHGIVRIFNTYGPRMNPNDGRVVINFLLQALRGESLTVYGDGQQTRSFCYVDDLVDGITAFAQSRERGPMNLGNGTEFTILELAQTVVKLFPQKTLRIEHKALPPDDPRQRRPDLALAQEKLNWQPKIDLKTGLARMLAWLQS